MASNLDELSAGGTETLPSGLLGFWKQTQTILGMDDMEELMALRELMLDKGTNTDASKKNKRVDTRALADLLQHGIYMEVTDMLVKMMDQRTLAVHGAFLQIFSRISR